MDRSFRKKCIVLLCFFVHIYAGSDEELFLSGNKLYEQGLYQKALASYDAIVKKGRAVLYNMGNCYYYTGDYAQASVYWGRAEHGATAQEIKRIAECHQRVMQKIGKQRESSWKEKVDYIAHAAVPYATLFLMQLFFLIWWCIVVCFVYHKGRSYRLATCLMFIGVLTLSVLLFVRYKKHYTICGVITKNKTSLFIGPNDAFHVKSTLDIPDRIEIQEQREGWYKVRYFDTIGWVKAESVQRI
jgi:tetratricopeptide (TPR) repeat protein